MTMPYIKKVCPQVEIEVTIHPQTHRIHSQRLGDTPQGYTPQSIITRGLVQTSGGNNNSITSYTINSPRFFKVYITTDVGNVTHLSSLQPTEGEVILKFLYSGDEVQCRVYSTADYRYNGWVRLDCTELPHQYTTHNPPFLK